MLQVDSVGVMIIKCSGMCKNEQSGHRFIPEKLRARINAIKQNRMQKSVADFCILFSYSFFKNSLAALAMSFLVPMLSKAISSMASLPMGVTLVMVPVPKLL